MGKTLINEKKSNRLKNNILEHILISRREKKIKLMYTFHLQIPHILTSIHLNEHGTIFNSLNNCIGNHNS